MFFVLSRIGMSTVMKRNTADGHVVNGVANWLWDILNKCLLGANIYQEYNISKKDVTEIIRKLGHFLIAQDSPEWTMENCVCFPAHNLRSSSPPFQTLNFHYMHMY